MVIVFKKYNVKTLLSHVGYNYTDAQVESEIGDALNLVEVSKEGKTYTL